MEILICLPREAKEVHRHPFLAGEGDVFAFKMRDGFSIDEFDLGVLNHGTRCVLSGQEVFWNHNEGLRQEDRPTKRPKILESNQKKRICAPGCRHVQESGTTEDFLFRHKDDFKKRAGELVELFSDEEPEKLIPDEEGCFPSPLFYRDEAKNGHTIEAIHFCILEADIKAIQNLTGEPIDAVTLFVTSQEEERLSHQDTLDLALLLEGPYGKSFFPGIRFDHRTLTCLDC